MRNKAWYPILYMFVITAFFSSVLIGLSRMTQERVEANERVAFERAVLNADKRLESVLAKARFWRDHASISLNDRQRKILNRMLDAGRGGFEGGLTTRKYVGLTRTSRATAGREIADLVAKGLLVRQPGGGRSTSYEIAW